MRLIFTVTLVWNTKKLVTSTPLRNLSFSLMSKFPNKFSSNSEWQSSFFDKLIPGINVTSFSSISDHRNSEIVLKFHPVQIKNVHLVSGALRFSLISSLQMQGWKFSTLDGSTDPYPNKQRAEIGMLGFYSQLFHYINWLPLTVFTNSKKNIMILGCIFQNLNLTIFYR